MVVVEIVVQEFTEGFVGVDRTSLVKKKTLCTREAVGIVSFNNSQTHSIYFLVVGQLLIIFTFGTYLYELEPYARDTFFR